MTIEQLRATKGLFKSATSLYVEIQANSDLKNSIEKLYFEVFGCKLNKGCSSCWFDAYVELIYQPIEKIMNQMECKFSLRAGALLIDVVNGDNKKMTTNNNLTDELALYHLKTNPSCRRFFTKPGPEELDEVIASLVETSNDKLKADASTRLLKIQKALNQAETAYKEAVESGDEAVIAKAKKNLDKIKQNEILAKSDLEDLK